MPCLATVGDDGGVVCSTLAVPGPSGVSPSLVAAIARIAHLWKCSVLYVASSCCVVGCVQCNAQEAIGESE